MEARLREFDFNDEDFNSLRALVRKHTGISLSDAKRELVYGRLSRRLRALGLEAFRMDVQVVDLRHALAVKLAYVGLGGGPDPKGG
jgi:chemotaxis protein methyltransferase CheR